MEINSSRRSFIKLTGLAALGLAGSGSILKAFASEAAVIQEKTPPVEIKKEVKSALTAKRWGMVIDTRKLQTSKDLEPITQICHKIHNVPTFSEKRHEIKWIWEEKYENAFSGDEHEYMNEKVENNPFLVLCNHCKNPACVRACPTKATFKRPSDGIVMMDMHRCIGCRFCMAACPYGARSFNFRDPVPFVKDKNLAYPTRMKGVVEKCTFCVERLAIGQLPACVEVSNGALIFGDLDDPNSQIRAVLKENFTIQRKIHLGTGPSVYYII